MGFFIDLGQFIFILNELNLYKINTTLKCQQKNIF